MSSELAQLDWEDVVPVALPALAAAEAMFAAAVGRPLVRRSSSSVYGLGPASPTAWTLEVVHAAFGTDDPAGFEAVNDLPRPMRDDPIGLVLAIYRVVPVLIESGAEDLARDLFAFYSDWDRAVQARSGPPCGAR